MRYTLAMLVLLLAPGFLAAAEPAVYEGTWKTTNRKLDGTMKCVVTPLASDRWQGRFYGIWQGVPFDYTVAFTGKPDDLRGTATIDHAHYDWTGSFSDENPRTFKGTFGGTRYAGYFNLQEKPQVIAARPSGQLR
jgi:hypothetical protein